ncbi:MAG: peptide chain release factor N(5)-glutamine methyltransferase [Bacillota bacterium]|jgi:release factor glutamine methyltransferase
MQRAAATLKEAGIQQPWFEAQLLLCWLLGKTQAEVLARQEDLLTDQQARQYWHLVEQRKKRRPLAYITGVRPFMGWDFHVTEAVLIPRPETEVLVELAVQQVNKHFPGEEVCIADIGTGCGAIGLSLLMLLPTARLCAVDSSPAALAIAKKNAAKFGLQQRVTFFQGDLLSPLEKYRGKLACIVANLPYIPQDEYAALQPEITEYEPRDALVSGEDGLWHYRRLLSKAHHYLVAGGLLLVEIGCCQGREVQEMFRQGGFSPRLAKDLAGRDRVVWGIKNPPAS